MKLETLKRNKLKFIWLVFAIIVASFLFYKEGKYTNDNNNKPINQSIDTFVPRNHRLVPIQISNVDAVKELIGDFAFVDLRDIKKHTLVMRSVKLIRSPIGDDIFAVLLRENEVNKLLQNGDHFFVVLRGPEENSEVATNSKQRKIIWED